MSTDDKSRATDNAFVESVRKTVKYEKIYLHTPDDGLTLFHMPDKYLTYYNYRQRHTHLCDEIPGTLYRAAASNSTFWLLDK